MTRALLLYLASGLLLVVAFALHHGVVSAMRRLGAHDPRTLGRVGAALALAAVLAPWAHAALGGAGPGHAPVQVWAERTDGARAGSPIVTMSWAAHEEAATGAVVALAPVLVRSVVVALGLGIGLALAMCVRDAVWLRRACRRLPIVHRFGRVVIAASDEARTAFAARFDGCAYIVIPSPMLADISNLRLVVGHEVMHHRRADLTLAWLIAVGRALFFWNPAAHAWARTLDALGEAACDQALLARGRWSGTSYARCLVWAAELARQNRYRTKAVTGMAAGSAASLRRRVEMLMSGHTDRRRWVVVSLGVLALGGLLGISRSVAMAVGDRRMTRTEVESLAARVPAQGALPVVVDDRLVEATNALVATPSGRDWARASLARMRTREAVVRAELTRANLPTELIAVALMESGFKEDAVSSMKAMGVWQLMAATGRRHGLVVDGQRDERRDVLKATRAAGVLLKRLNERYHDWVVALAAYNLGEQAIDTLLAGSQGAAARHKVMDGKPGRYVRSVMSGVLLLRDPTLVD